MKNISLVVALLVSALVIGCQDTNQYNPLSSNSSTPSHVAKMNSRNPDGILDLKAELTVGSLDGANNTYNVTGSIQYTLVSNQDGTFTFSSVTAATVHPIAQKDIFGKVYGESIEQLTFSGKEVVSYERAYPIKELDKNLTLNVSFTLSASKVLISNVWLTDGLPHGGFVQK